MQIYFVKLKKNFLVCSIRAKLFSYESSLWLTELLCFVCERILTSVVRKRATYSVFTITFIKYAWISWSLILRVNSSRCHKYGGRSLTQRISVDLVSCNKLLLDLSFHRAVHLRIVWNKILQLRVWLCAKILSLLCQIKLFCIHWVPFNYGHYRIF